MPESHGRKAAAQKKKIRQHETVAERRQEKAVSKAAPGEFNRYIPWIFLALLLLGTLWLVTYYVAGAQIPFMAKLGDWNMLVGMVLMLASFIVASFWK